MEKLSLSSESLQAEAKPSDYRLFTSNGGEIDDLELIRDDERLYLVASGEPFTGGLSTSGESTYNTDLPSCDSKGSEGKQKIFKDQRKSSSRRRKTEKQNRSRYQV